MRFRKVALIAGTVLSMVATAFIHVSAQDSVPSWVGEDSEGNFGLIDVDGMPEQLPVLDSEGNIVGYADTEDLYAAPSDDPSSEQAARRLKQRSARNGRPTTSAEVPVYDAQGERIGVVGSTGFEED